MAFLDQYRETAESMGNEDIALACVLVEKLHEMKNRFMFSPIL